jgi:hypothetical protein
LCGLKKAWCLSGCDRSVTLHFVACLNPDLCLAQFSPELGQFNTCLSAAVRLQSASVQQNFP